MQNNLKCKIAVVKIASRCNINCSYCYMYNKGDDTYKKQPKFMSKEVMIAFFEKVKLHCLRHDIPGFHFVMHGGEPMLAGQQFFKDYVRLAKEILLPEVTPTFVIQTNGILLTPEWCELLFELDIAVGVSVDGDQEAHDEFRIDHQGKGTYDRVVKGLKIAQKSSLPGPGVLTVINYNADPLKTYQHFKDLGIPKLDLLIPDYTYADPPPGFNGDLTLFRKDTPMADWLIPLFDTWFYEGKNKPEIRLFKYLISIILGGSIAADFMGTERNEVLVIETNGDIETSDTLRICGNGFTRDGANVLTHELDEALQTDLARLYHLSKERLCKQCSNCPINEVCGGGFIAHRYKKENGFNNPSFYCADLIKLITHIQAKVIDALPKEMVEANEISAFTPQEVKDIIMQRMSDSDEPAYLHELENYSKILRS